MRYHSHLVSCHSAIRDDTGIEITDVEMAKTDALRSIWELPQDVPEAGETWQDWRLDIADSSARSTCPSH